jgi:hypothetical protein
VKLSPKSLLIESGVGEDIVVLLEQAIAAHVDTGRNAKVTFVVTVRTDPDSGKIKAGGRVQAVLPTGDSDTITKKMPSIGLITVANDCPGQQKIDGLGPHEDDELTVEQVVARLNLAIAGTGKTTSAYAKANGLPYLALAKLLSSGCAGDDASYAPIYDHALTLNCEPVADVEQDNKSKAAG